ncbi:unnamed protein product [Schistosoma mattheei]|uniref:Uncharacterized protein n=1 Tax=Schistosoma mattheei TaxID=31246 RepID=A0A183PDL1_9TREM|nr:unnamed protein product [Schistosoma mattheei]
MRCLEFAGFTCHRGDELPPVTGILTESIGKSMVQILDTNDSSTQNQHVDQIQFQELGDSTPISVANIEQNLDHIVYTHYAAEQTLGRPM